MIAGLSVLEFFGRLTWLDGRPLLEVVESYRRRLFEQAFERDETGRFHYNLILCGRAKKNWKTADLALAALTALVSDPAPGYDNDCSLLANDTEQARDDLALAKKLVAVNPVLDEWLRVKKDVIERQDGCGFLEILPAGDVAGSHGKSRRLVAYDEIHAYRNWDIFEAMQPDPHRLDAQQWVTSYASLIHRPGAPLFDLMAAGKRGNDPRMLFSWYGADYTTDAAFVDCAPEMRANPSMGSWGDAGYLAQQQRRLPAHKYRRLHLNLPGLPEGSAFSAEGVMDAVQRGVPVRFYDASIGGARYQAFVDMSGGSSDDAVLAIGHQDAAGRFVLDVVQDQGPQPPFDPLLAVDRFIATLRMYRLQRVTGDRYAGETFRRAFESRGVKYAVAEQTKSELYEAFEPRLNSHQVVMLDIPKLEQQLLGLVWRGGRIDHPASEHDDFANAVAGCVQALATPAPGPCVASITSDGAAWQGRYFR